MLCRPHRLSEAGVASPPLLGPLTFLDSGPMLSRMVRLAREGWPLALPQPPQPLEPRALHYTFWGSACSCLKTPGVAEFGRVLTTVRNVSQPFRVGHSRLPRPWGETGQESGHAVGACVWPDRPGRGAQPFLPWSLVLSFSGRLGVLASGDIHGGERRLPTP